uniref:Uncharacterized protein n=1 Tax=Arion vulgaris TaxID=1028688 RepID=A0A0B6YAQ4_9EUPU
MNYATRSELESSLFTLKYEYVQRNERSISGYQDLQRACHAMALMTAISCHAMTLMTAISIFSAHHTLNNFIKDV